MTQRRKSWRQLPLLNWCRWWTDELVMMICTYVSQDKKPTQDASKGLVFLVSLSSGLYKLGISKPSWQMGYPNLYAAPSLTNSPKPWSRRTSKKCRSLGRSSLSFLNLLNLAFMCAAIFFRWYEYIECYMGVLHTANTDLISESDPARCPISSIHRGILRRGAATWRGRMSWKISFNHWKGPEVLSRILFPKRTLEKMGDTVDGKNNKG